MLEEIFARIKKRKVRLKIDKRLQRHVIATPNKVNDLEFSIFELIYAAGASQAITGSTANKFAITADLLEAFVGSKNNELWISGANKSIEDKKRISERLGEGLSWIIAEKVYGIDKSTIERIPRRGRESMPDFKGESSSKIITWEAKGSLNQITNARIEKAKDQKSKMQAHADLAFASIAALKADSISEVYVEDPEPLPLTGERLVRELSRIRHYINLFDFIGETKLSRYFKLLGTRLEKDRNFPEFDEKERLFEDLRIKSARLYVNNSGYLGRVERVGPAFMYVGFDEKLITVDGFLNYKDKENDEIVEKELVTFAITTDGICYGYFKDISGLTSLKKTNILTNIDLDQIKNYMDSVSIYDLDNVLESQLIDYIKYIFERSGFEVEKESRIRDVRFDLLITKNQKRIAVEVKRQIIIRSYEQVIHYRPCVLIITQKYIADADIEYAKDNGVVIIDRRRLKAIIKRKLDPSDLLN